MASTLPPDPYKLLGVSKDAKLAEIRSAHRKLVLKCHPDKVQDAALKAIKVDEFQKVQQAYELLSDETRRLQYDEQVKLFELRKEMGRGNPTARSNPFEYEVKTAEPRPDSFNRPQPSPKYAYTAGTPPRSHEPVYEEPRHMPKKPTSFEERDRKRSSRDDELRREARLRQIHEEEEDRARREKEAKRSSHNEKKKSRDKERKRGSEEKMSRTRGAYVDEDDSDEYGRTPPRTSEKKSTRHKSSMEDDIRTRDDGARAEDAARKAARSHEQRVPTIKEAPLDPKWSEHMEYAGAYMQAARRKVTVEETPHAPPPPHPGMRRAETFAAPASGPYNVRYTTTPAGQYSDDEDTPRRSSARKESRRTSDTPPSRKKSRERERKRSPSHQHDAFVVEPPSPPATSRKPSLQTHSSAPPVFTREKPSRSKTEYPSSRSKDPMPMPGIPRAHTFSESRSRERGSKLKQEMSSDSESDNPVYHPSPRVSHSPPRRAPEPTRYIVTEGRANPISPNTSRHRADLRDLNEAYPRERSVSPGGIRYSTDRPSVARNPSSTERVRGSSRNQTTYYTPGPGPGPEPIILSARPKMSSQPSSHRAANYDAPPAGQPFQKVSYAKNYTPDQVIYAAHPANLYDNSRRSRDHEDYYTSHARGSRGGEVYVG